MGRLVIGTPFGLACKNGESILDIDARGVDHPSILSMASTRDGDVWAGSDAGCLLYRTGDGFKVESLPDIGLEGIYGISEDAESRVWVGGSEGYLGCITESGFRRVRGCLLDGIYVMFHDSQGRLWCGSYGRSPALCYYDGESFHIPKGEGLEDIRYVNAICETDDETLWIGTANGLFAYDADKEEARHFTMADGLSENAVTALCVDTEGFLWIGTSGGGAVCYDGAVFKIVKLGNSAPENKVESILCDSRGRMWFGTRDGLAIYNKGHIPPGIVIRKVTAGETVVEPQRVEFNESVREARIAFQGIGFRSGARQLCYSYRVDGPGFADGWSKFSRASEVVMGGLKAGEYLFSVRAMDRDGLISPHAKLSLEVAPDTQRDRIQALEDALKSGDQNLICDSEAMRASLENIALVAETDFSVLILGETGTGKGLVARILHDMSDRKDKPFIPLNCGAIPEGLVESELFGHEKGAFTGAVDRKLGYFELAVGGTLFLDEIGDLPVTSQRVLLHVLEQKEVTRVGGTKSIPLDVRIVAATNRDLDRASREGTFRQDLFYRLDQYTLTLPPLRDRGDDIPSMMDHFIQATARHLNRAVPELGPGVVEYLQVYAWPGNVREFEHILQRAVLICKEDTIQIEDLPVLSTNARTVALSKSESSEIVQQRDAADDEKGRILEALRMSNGMVYGDRGAAKILGIHPECLRSRMRKYGIPSPRQRRRRS